MRLYNFAMKIICPLLLLMLISVNIASQTHWRQVPLDIRDDFTGLHFIDENHGFLVTKRGMIVSVKLTDSTVMVEREKYRSDLYDIYFRAGGSAGFAVGSNGKILKTHDYGQNWDSLTYDLDIRFTHLAFSDSLNGYLVGAGYGKNTTDSGVVLKTTDGGETWVLEGTMGRKMKYVDISPQNIIMLVGYGMIFTSSDNGLNWDTAALKTGKLPMAGAIRDNNGIIVGSSGLLALSSDRGRSWEMSEILSDTASFFDVLMLDSKRAYIVGSGGEILYTDDAGRNWIPEASATGSILYAIHRVGQRVFVCGQHGALIYTDLKK